MPSQAEIPISVRGWTGVNVALDPCFLRNTDLQSSENWAPSNLTGTLSTRNGTGVPALTFNSTRITEIVALTRTYDTNSPPNLLMFAVAHMAVGGDQLFVNVNNNVASGPIIGGLPFSTGRRYSMAVIGNRLYVSNGVDQFIKTVLLSSPFVAVDFTAFGLTNTTGQSATPVAATGFAALDQGTYSYAWAVYDPATQQFVSRSGPLNVMIDANNQLQFTAPSTALTGTQVYILFVAEVNLPIEFATSQTPTGLAAGGTILVSHVTLDGPRVPLDGNVARTGNILVAHRGSLFIAGDQANPSKLYQTGPIAQGLEQEEFNLGDFFPALNVLNVSINDGDVITGLGIASLTTTQQSPSSPLAIFKNFSTSLLLGDLSNPQVTQLSSRVGCIAQATIVNTPLGLIFCGQESVYLLPPALQEPVDIGWPISPIIRAVPTNFRDRCFAVYHNFFYKLFYVPAGANTVRQEFWLDLHQGQGIDSPAWYGPMTHGTIAYSIATTGQRDPTIGDQAWAALAIDVMALGAWNGTWDGTWAAGSSIGDVLPLDADGSLTDAGVQPIIPRLTTKRFDASAPFQRKLFTGVRVVAQSSINSVLNVTMLYDGGLTTTPVPLAIGGAALGQWDGQWDGSWGTSIFVEGDTRLLADLDRQPHTTADVSLIGPPMTAIDLRDFELRYLPIERIVG